MVMVLDRSQQTLDAPLVSIGPEAITDFYTNRTGERVVGTFNVPPSFEGLINSEIGLDVLTVSALGRLFQTDREVLNREIELAYRFGLHPGRSLSVALESIRDRSELEDRAQQAGLIVST